MTFILFSLHFKTLSFFYFFHIVVLVQYEDSIILSYCNACMGIYSNLKCDILYGIYLVAGVWRRARFCSVIFLFFLLAVLLVRDELASPGNMLWIV